MERMANYFSDYFHFILLGGDAGREGVFHSENEMDCKNYYWEILGLLDGLELGSEDANNGYRR